jgi:hypothetical protein
MTTEPFEVAPIDSVRIDDFAHPRFSPEAEQIVAAIASLEPTVELSAQRLYEDAIALTGLDDFGRDPTFRNRVDVYVGALRGEANLSPVGRVTQYLQVRQFLMNRLLVEDLLKRHPEIAQVPIERPIVIVGMPRTGTTHLHNLMAADPAVRALPYWESLEPVLAPGERAGDGQPDPRIERAEVATSTLDVLMPYFARMHEMTAEHVHEEIQLLAIDFSTMLFETTAIVPTWRDYYATHDQTPHYRYLRKLLQVCQWQRGGVRWVLKSPQHLEQFRALIEVFPDATFVVTYRDPLAIVASFVTMVTYTARMSVASIDPHAYGRYWSDRIEQMLRACTRDHDLLPADRTVDVQFRDFMRDDIATVESIYEVAQQPSSETALAGMRRFMADHPRGRHGRVHYDLGDFGLEEDVLREQLGFYVDRFGVEEEALNR